MNIPIEKFNELYANHYKILVRYAKSIVHDESVAEEIVQETFFRLFKQDYNKIITYVKQWLYTVCYNHSLKVLRKETRYVDGEEDESIDESRNPSESLLFQEKVKALKKCMRKLTPNRRNVLKHRFYKDLNYMQSAKKMKTTEGNIGFLQHAALKDLKVMMKKELNK